MPNGTYGGVRGRRLTTASYSIFSAVEFLIATGKFSALFLVRESGGVKQQNWALTINF
jgi:hypothetical protein